MFYGVLDDGEFQCEWQPIKLFLTKLKFWKAIPSILFTAVLVNFEQKQTQKLKKIIFSYMTDIFHIMYCVDCSSSDIWVWIIPQYKLTQNETLLQSYSSPFVTTSDSEVPSKNVQCQIMPACKNLDLLCDDLKNILDAAPSHASQTLLSVLSEFSTIKAEIF